MAKKGQNWYGLPTNHPTHHRMARVLKAFKPDEPVAVWDMVVADMGLEKALSMPKAKARHLVERTIVAAERCGFIRRLPLRMRPKGTEPYGSSKFRRGLVYVITDDGLLFVERHEKYVKQVTGQIEERKLMQGIHYLRTRKYIAKRRRRELRIIGS